MNLVLPTTKHIAMFLNHFKLAWRNLRKNRVYSFINIFGLTVGLSCFLLISLYIFDELTFDQFHKNAGSIYRVIDNRTTASGKETKIVSSAFNISEQGKKDFPEIANAARFSMFGRVNVYNEAHTQAFYEFFNIGDEQFFNVFSFPVIGGNTASALKEPRSVVLTEESAMKLFGRTDIVGKPLQVETDSFQYKVTAVIRIPNNSHLQFNMIFSEASFYADEGFKRMISNDWASNNFVTYLHLKENTDAKQFESKLSSLVNSKRTAQQPKSDFDLQPLADIHFYSEGVEGTLANQQGNIMHMYVFGIVALFVLLIACINYMNLTTARFAGRSKEIAIRKVAGADQPVLIKQFLSEAFLVTIIAFILALGIVKLVLPEFNAFSAKKLVLDRSTDYRIWLGMIGTVIIAGLLSGLYPAFFQSRLKPYLLLKNKINLGKGNLSLRRTLVVVQFSLSIIMIIATVIVYQQIRYVGTKDMGFNREQLLVVDINSGAVRRAAETIKSEYGKIAGVQTVSVTSRVPGEWKVLPKIKVKIAGKTNQEGEDLFFIGADDQFLKTFEVNLLSGRNFSGANQSDSSAVLLNEAAAKLLGVTNPTEQPIEIPTVSFGGNAVNLRNAFRARVIGIVKDFNFQSLREKIGPMVIAYQRNPVHNIDYFTARVETANMASVLKQMEGVLQKIDANHLFEYNFLDKQWEAFYREDEKRQIIFLGVALMTILIACLGLFGLATYAAEQRIKEIGIRKVLGASIGSIVSLLSRDFLKLVLIAAIIAFPISWWAMKNWLSDFAYRINIHWWVFLIAGGLAVLIALATVSFQAIKAAVSNPIKSLRSE